MTQFPPPSPPPSFGYGYSAAPRRTSAAAVTSLVLGLLMCIPITGLLAIIFGAIGIRKTRNPAVSGHGMAVAGLVLGIISVVAWGVIGYGYLQSIPAQAVANQFFRDVNSGNITGAMNNSLGISAAQLRADHEQMIRCGTLQSLRFARSFNFNMINGQTTMRLSALAGFSSLPKICTFDLAKTGETYKVVAYSFQ